MKEIKKITSSLLGRNLKIASMVGKSASKMLFNRDQSLKESLAKLLSEESHKMVNDLGLMKGSIMKAGQLLSLYADVILPKEVQNLFTSLEDQSFYLPWSEISKNLPPHIIEELNFEQTPLAAASLGQVHRAKKDSKNYVVKIQYRGVKKAIKNDIRVLKWIISMTNFIPKDIDLSPLFEDLKEMLHQETDYLQEARFMQDYACLVENDDRFRIPRVYPNLSGDTYITQDYMEGISPRKIGDIDQAIRNRLGKDFFELFFLELFEWGLMQTDPNPGNYLISPDYQQWILLDFGASQRLDPILQQMYREVISCVITGSSEEFTQLLKKYRYIKETESDVINEYFNIIHHPFTGDVYDWGNSNITDKLFKIAPRLFKEISPDKPPKDITFIDRKIGGVFFILKLLGSRFNPLEVLDKFQKGPL